MIANCNWIGRHYNNEALIFALHHICAAQAHTHVHRTAVNHMIAFDMAVRLVYLNCHSHVLGCDKTRVRLAHFELECDFFVSRFSRTTQLVTDGEMFECVRVGGLFV